MQTVEIKRYDSTGAYQRDAKTRFAEGWTIIGQTQDSGQTHRVNRSTNLGCLGFILFGWWSIPLMMLVGALSNSRKAGAITVTWAKA
jgi:hypothetical protein